MDENRGDRRDAQANDIGNGVNGRELQDHLGELGSGGDTLAGAGDPSGGAIGATAGTAAGPGGAHPATSGASGAAAEAAALGAVDGSLADYAAQAEPGAERLSGGPAGGETLGAGAGRGDVGSGTPADRGDLGGGGAEGSTLASASPGGDGRA
jgi:hypothetical protein